MRDRKPSVYEASYAFNGYWRGRHAGAIEKSLAVVQEMQADGLAIEHLGTTLYTDPDGVVTDVVARYRAPSEGLVGWHGCRARLPVSGFVRLADGVHVTESDASHSTPVSASAIG